MTDHDAIAARVRQDRETGTPGPWRVGPVDDTIVTAADGSEVAAVDGDYNEPDLWPIMEANARRIATLPDLEAAYLDLYDEVKRLRATGEIDRKFARKTADDVFAWKSRAEKAEAERDRLRAVLLKIAEYLPSFDYVARDEFGRCTDLPGSPYDRGKADASARLTAIARAALKGDSDE